MFNTVSFHSVITVHASGLTTSSNFRTRALRTQHRKCVMIALIVLTPSVTVAQTEARSATRVLTKCQLTRWSKATPLRSDRTAESIAVRFPSIASTAKALFVAGNSLSLQGEMAVTSPALIALEQGEGAIGQPPGTFSFSFPRIAIDQRGNLQALWGEPEMAQVKSGMGVLRHIRSIWTASYDVKGRVWSAPTRLFESSLFSLTWSPRGETIRSDEHESLYLDVLLPLPDTKEDIVAGRLASSLVRLRFDADGWHTTKVTLPGRAVEASTARGNGYTYIAYIGPSTHGGHENSVHFARSADDGKTWASAHLIGASTDVTPANFLTLLRGHDGAIHINWRQATSQGANVLRHVTSHDDGTTWSAPHDLSPGARSGGEVYAVDLCGRVHVAFDAVGPDDVPRITHSIWNGQWSSPSVPFPTLGSVDAGLARGHDGRILMTFVGWPLKGQRQVEQSWITELSK